MSSNDLMQKKCNACEVWKPLTEFYTAGKNKDGSPRYASRCKPCCRTAKREAWQNGGRWKNHRAYVRARNRTLTRLRWMMPELYELILEKELKKEGVPFRPKTDGRSRRSLTITREELQKLP